MIIINFKLKSVEPGGEVKVILDVRSQDGFDKGEEKLCDLILNSVQKDLAKCVDPMDPMNQDFKNKNN